MQAPASHHEPSSLTGISLLLPITLSTMAIVLLAPILPLLLAEFKDVPNYEYWVPMVLTVPALCVALLSPIGGMLGDYFGRRKLLIASFVLYAVVGVAPIFLDDFWAILFSRVGVGVAEALIMVLSTTMIGDYFRGRSRERWLALQTTTASLSAMLFFVVGGYLGSFGWRTPFWIYLSALVMMALVIRYTWELGAEDRTGDPGDAPRKVSWAAFPWAVFIPVMLVTVFSGVFFYTVQIQASIGLTDLGLADPQKIGWLTAAASLGVPLGTVIFAKLLVGKPPLRLLLLEFVLLAAGFAVMGLAKNPTAFLLGCFLNQLGAGMLLPTLLVWAMSYLSFEIRGRGAGLWQSSFAASQFLSPLVVTALAKNFGGLFSAFLGLSIAAAIAAIVTLPLAARKVQARTAEDVTA